MLWSPRCCRHKGKCNVQLLKAKAREEKEQINKKNSKFIPTQAFWILDWCCSLRRNAPGVLEIILLLVLLPLSAACVERLFSKMILAKSRFANYLVKSIFGNLFIGTAMSSSWLLRQDVWYFHWWTKRKKSSHENGCSVTLIT